MRVSLRFSLLLVLGCAGPAPIVDAGNPDAGPIVGPAPPMPPALPVIPVGGGCSPGWALVEEEGLPPYCDPYPTGVVVCADKYEEHWPGASGCALVGPPCVAVPTSPPGTNATYFVSAGAGGDGSMTNPFGTIGAALAVAADGDAILVLPGTYLEPLVIDRPLSIIGACARDTRIVMSEPSDDQAVIFVAAPGVRIAGLTVTGARHGIHVASGAEATISGVAFVDVTRLGLNVEGTAYVEDSLARTTDGLAVAATSVAMHSRAGGDLTVVRSSLRGHPVAEAVIRGTATFEDCVFGVGNDPTSGDANRGVDASGGHAIVRRSVVDRVRVQGFTAYPDGELDIEDSALLGVGGAYPGTSVAARERARITIARTTIARPSPFGVAAFEGSTIEAEDLLVLDAMEDSANRVEGTAVLSLHGTVALRRAFLARSTSFALYLTGASRTTLEDVTVFDTRLGEPFESFSTALGMVSGATADVRRLRIEGADQYGITVADAGSILRGEDVEIRGGRAARRALGLLAASEATVELDRVRVTDNHGIGVMVFSSGTQVVLRDVEVSDTHPIRCLGADCPGFLAYGIGVGAYGGGEVAVSRFVLARNQLSGAQVAYGFQPDLTPYEEGGVLNLSDGLIEGNTIGVNVQLTDYDYDRLTDRVLFRDNVRNLAGEALEVPPLALP